MSGPSSVEGPPITDKRQLVEYHASGNKPPEQWRVGTEHEKFVFRRADLLEVHAHEIVAAVVAVEHEQAALGVDLREPQLAKAPVQAPAEITVVVAREVPAHGFGGS